MKYEPLCYMYVMHYNFLCPLCSTDETSTENVLKSLQTFANVSGRVGLTTPRDAFITALCKASLPSHYNLGVLNSTPAALVPNRGT